MARFRLYFYLVASANMVLVVYCKTIQKQFIAGKIHQIKLLT